MKTHTIEFRAVNYSDPATGRTIPVLGVLVDGIDFIKLVAQTEVPCAQVEGNPSIAGGYRGLGMEYVAPPSQHLLGEPTHPVYSHSDKVQILECECGEPGCWPLLCRISVLDDRVVWSDFEQPHRTGGFGQAPWSYAGLGPLRFDRVAYEAALARLTPGSDR